MPATVGLLLRPSGVMFMIITIHDGYDDVVSRF